MGILACVFDIGQIKGFLQFPEPVYPSISFLRITGVRCIILILLPTLGSQNSMLSFIQLQINKWNPKFKSLALIASASFSDTCFCWCLDIDTVYPCPYSCPLRCNHLGMLYIWVPLTAWTMLDNFAFSFAFYFEVRLVFLWTSLWLTSISFWWLYMSFLLVLVGLIFIAIEDDYFVF